MTLSVAVGFFVFGCVFAFALSAVFKNLSEAIVSVAEDILSLEQRIKGDRMYAAKSRGSMRVDYSKRIQELTKTVDSLSQKVESIVDSRIELVDDLAERGYFDDNQLELDFDDDEDDDFDVWEDEL